MSASHDERVQTAAQMIHEQRHRAGMAQECDSCRQLAERLAELFGGTR